MSSSKHKPTMNPDIKQAFTFIKPQCDSVMANPTPATVAGFIARLNELKNEAVQEMQLYLLFPIVTHLKRREVRGKNKLESKLLEALKVVLERVTVTNTDMFEKYHSCLLPIVFDKEKPGMVADAPEEIKLSVIECMTRLCISLDQRIRVEVFRTKVPILAQTIFISVHIAKLHRLRALRISAINCLLAYTGLHDHFVHRNLEISHRSLAKPATDLAASILPGVMAALQDVAISTDNPGHAVVAAALNAIHRIVCLVMNDRHLVEKENVSMDDFAKILEKKAKISEANEVDESKDKKLDPFRKRNSDWYYMCGTKLKCVTQSLMSLQTHEHVKVRRELCVYCARLLFECNKTMKPSIPIALDILIALSKDEYEEVSSYCTEKLHKYFNEIPQETRHRTMDCLQENFLELMMALPRILNNIDSGKKLASLNLLHGYLSTNIPNIHSHPRLSNALIEAARIDASFSILTQSAIRDFSSPPPATSPWCKLRHLDDARCEARLRECCRLLGDAECADLIVDQLLDAYHDSVTDRSEIVYLLNWIGSAPNSDLSVTKRILNKYIEEDVWYLPLEVATGDEAVTSEETLDQSVYNPRAWERDSVPGLYEGTTETRYTDISYARPKPVKRVDPLRCPTLAHAQTNMALSCLTTEGVGLLAYRLKEEFQSYLLKTLCLILERVGSSYEMLHLAGVKAINDITRAWGLKDVPELIKTNADYFTYQVTTRLKKSWNSQSALQILTVVMEYSDVGIFDCLYGIVSDVLVQSCDKYHENDLSAYLQVFLTFIMCVHKWFPQADVDVSETEATVNQIDVMADTREYIKNAAEFERLMNSEDLEDINKSVEEMYLEDLKRKEDELLDYDDKVTEEKPPLPQHIKLTVTILKRCLNFIPSKRRDEKLLALQVINKGLTILKAYEDELLPLVHLVWAPLVNRFEEVNEPVILRRAFEVLVTMAALSKDFIRDRTVKEVLPNLYKFLISSSKKSHLKDVGSSYRQTHAFKLQTVALDSLPDLVVDLSLDESTLKHALTCVEPYLSDRQPKPLQTLAVKFYQRILKYDYGAVWSYLRDLCKNECTLEPPKIEGLELSIVVGAPHEPIDKSYKKNINLIFKA